MFLFDFKGIFTSTRKIKYVFYRCPNSKLYSKWSNLINRMDLKVTMYSKVCSNHFKSGRPTEDDPFPSLFLNGYSDETGTRKRPPPKLRDNIVPLKKKKAPLANPKSANHHVSGKQVLSWSNKENQEPQTDFCNKQSSTLRSESSSETINVQVGNESGTIVNCAEEDKSDPYIDHCYQETSEPSKHGCARAIPSPYYSCSHCSKLRDQITKLNQELDQLKVYMTYIFLFAC